MNSNQYNFQNSLQQDTPDVFICCFWSIYRRLLCASDNRKWLLTYKVRDTQGTMQFSIGEYTKHEVDELLRSVFTNLGEHTEVSEVMSEINVGEEIIICKTADYFSLVFYPM